MIIRILSEFHEGLPCPSGIMVKKNRELLMIDSNGNIAIAKETCIIYLRMSKSWSEIRVYGHKTEY